MDAKPKKLLLVDDEQDIVTYLSQILKRADYEVRATTKGREAIELARSFKPDLIILDVMMPDLSGEEIAGILSEQKDTKDIPILFLTAILTKGEETADRKTGKNYLMAKPVTPVELKDMVRKILVT